MLQISRIYKDSVECVCGAYILPGELSYPVCHKFLQKDGSFIESRRCPGCGNYVKIISRFCTVCAHSFDGSDEVASEDVEMVQCRKCHGGVKVGKKFCALCGAQMKGNEKAFVKIDVPIAEKTGSSSAGEVGSKTDDNVTAEERSPARERFEAPKFRFCTQCGNELKPGKSFCSKCGNKIIRS